MHGTSFNGSFHSPVFLCSKAYQTVSLPTNHPCSWEMCILLQSHTWETISWQITWTQLVPVLPAKMLVCRAFKILSKPKAIFSGLYYSWSAMNIYSSQAFSKHPTQLHQQLHSWLCQGQAKQFQYCRVGHQNTLLNVSSMTGVTLRGIATDLLLRNGLLYVTVPHLYWDLSSCSPGVHMLACSAFMVNLECPVWDRKLAVSFLITCGFDFINVFPDFYLCLVKFSRKQKICSVRSHCEGYASLSLHKSSWHTLPCPILLCQEELKNLSI